MDSTLGAQMHEDIGQEKNTKVECDCKAVLNTWKVLSKRWSLLILKSLDSKESTRFNELKRTLFGISSTVLADRLLELEREGLLIKKIYPEIPPKVEYSLTYQAKELGFILVSLGEWVRKWNIKIKTSPTRQDQLQTQIKTIKKIE